MVMVDYSEFCLNDKHTELCQAINETGSITQAAIVLNKDRRACARMFKRIKARAAAAGYAPEEGYNKKAKTGFSVERTTELLGPDGEQKLIWVREKADKVNHDDFIAAIGESMAEYNGLGGVVQKPKLVDADHLSVYPMGDPHIGMYCWAAESGEDFDTELATTQLVEAMVELVDASPPSQYALILNLGDFFHSDTLDNETRRSGHSLDVDTRMSKVWVLGMTAMIACIDAAREKHRFVTVRNEIGNHDDHTAMLLSIALKAYFKDEPRVVIDTSPKKFFYYHWNNVLIGTTHGDTCKFPRLAGVMAADCPKEWGNSIHRYWYTGHFHSSKVEEYPGVLCEQFRTLAAKDAYTAGAGYRSGRDMRVIVHHREHGEVQRHRVDVKKLRTQPK
jgi:hypothetical protein